MFMFIWSSILFKTCIIDSSRLMAIDVDRELTDVVLLTDMKKDLHPDNYRLVVFEDLNNGFKFLTRSTTASDEAVKWEDGNEYPLVKVHITSASHPFFTGEERILDIEGRVDKFKARAAAGAAAKDKRAAAAQKQAKRQTAKIEKAEAKAENAKPVK
jgi:large subunit ribosomal protein L31